MTPLGGPVEPEVYIRQARSLPMVRALLAGQAASGPTVRQRLAVQAEPRPRLSIPSRACSWPAGEAVPVARGRPAFRSISRIRQSSAAMNVTWSGLSLAWTTTKRRLAARATAKMAATWASVWADISPRGRLAARPCGRAARPGASPTLPAGRTCRANRRPARPRPAAPDGRPPPRVRQPSRSSR